MYKLKFLMLALTAELALCALTARSKSDRLSLVPQSSTKSLIVPQSRPVAKRSKHRMVFEKPPPVLPSATTSALVPFVPLPTLERMEKLIRRGTKVTNGNSDYTGLYEILSMVGELYETTYHAVALYNVTSEKDKAALIKEAVDNVSAFLKFALLYVRSCEKLVDKVNAVESKRICDGVVRAAANDASLVSKGTMLLIHQLEKRIREPVKMDGERYWQGGTDSEQHRQRSIDSFTLMIDRLDAASRLPVASYPKMWYFWKGVVTASIFQLNGLKHLFLRKNTVLTPNTVLVANDAISRASLINNMLTSKRGVVIGNNNGARSDVDTGLLLGSPGIDKHFVLDSPDIGSVVQTDRDFDTMFGEAPKATIASHSL